MHFVINVFLLQSHGQVQFLCRVLTALGPTAGERGGKAKGVSLVAESVRILIKASKMSAFAHKQLAGLRLSRKVKGLPSEDDVVARAVSLSQEKKFAFAGTCIAIHAFRTVRASWCQIIVPVS